MIKVFIFGGLGNQMFQYATGKSLAEKTNEHLCIDTSLLYINSKNITPRNYELDQFVLDEHKNKITSSWIRGYFYLKIYPKIKKTFLSNLIKKNNLIFEDIDPFNFNPKFSHLQRNTILLGYFQSELYFSSYENNIRKAFKFRKDLSGINKDTADKIKAVNAVSVHIRRGDYLSNKNSADTYTSVSDDYYIKAINYIKQFVENPVFYIFSDEPESAKLLINKPEAIYVDWNKGADSYIDMQLMSACKHNIIANSSFSWWGAWLNSNHEKIVIAPKGWLKDEKANNTIKDLIPKTWIRL